MTNTNRVKIKATVENMGRKIKEKAQTTVCSTITTPRQHLQVVAAALSDQHDGCPVPEGALEGRTFVSNRFTTAHDRRRQEGWLQSLD